MPERCPNPKVARRLVWTTALTLSGIVRAAGWLALWVLAFGVEVGQANGSKPGSAGTDTLAIEGLGKGTARLDGNWEFHTGDNANWADPRLDDSTWERITADQPWGSQPGYARYTGYAWYRRHISVSRAPGVAPELAILIEHVDDAYELYWNGVLIGRNGQLPPHPAWYNDQAPQTFGLGPITSGVLAMRVWKAPLVSYDSGDGGGLAAPPEIGSPAAIFNHKCFYDYAWLRGHQFVFALDYLYALAALLCLLAWLRDRSQSILFWMGGFSLAPLLVLFLDELRLKWPFDLSLGLQQPAYSLEDVSLWFMLLWLLELHAMPRLVRITWVLGAVNFGSTIFDGFVEIFGWSSSWSGVAEIIDAVMTAVLTLTEVLPLVLVIVAVTRHRRLDPARWLVAITAFLTVMMSVIQVASSQGSRYTHWTIAERISAPLFVIIGNPVSPYTLFRTLLVVALIYAIYRYYAAAGHRRESLERELQSARELQQVLIPETPPTVPGFTLTGAYRPAQEVGGDFFQIIPLGEGFTLILLGDVSGKGLRAAMAVALILGATRALAPTFPDPAMLLEELNQSLHGKLQGGFATCVALRISPEGQCLIASAGHPSPFLNGRELSLPGALPLALIPKSLYETVAVQLKLDDCLVLYTDGLLEARNEAGELYSFERLAELFAQRPTADEATEAAVSFGQDDDITVLTLTRREPERMETTITRPYISETQTIRLYPAS